MLSSNLLPGGMGVGRHGLRTGQHFNDANLGHGHPRTHRGCCTSVSGCCSLRLHYRNAPKNASDLFPCQPCSPLWRSRARRSEAPAAL